MTQFTNGEHQVRALRAFKDQMQTKVTELKQTTEINAQIKLIDEILNEHFDRMRSLSRIYEQGSPRADKIKETIRSLYEKVTFIRDNAPGLKEHYREVDLKTEYVVLNTKKERDGDFAKKLDIPRQEVKAPETRPPVLEKPRVTAAPSSVQNNTAVSLPVQNVTKNSLSVKRNVIQTPTVLSPNAPELVAIDKILAELKDKIGTINQHKYKKAVVAATTLMDALEIERNQFAEGLEHNNNSKLVLFNQFKVGCSNAINTAKPALMNDLGWGDYLNNLLKKLVNAVTKTITFGTAHTLFTPIKSESLKAVEQSEHDLNKIKPTTDGTCQVL